jgi:hypothetical protein
MAHDVRYEDSPAEGYEESLAGRARRANPPRDRETLGSRQDRVWKAAEMLDNAVDSLTARISPVLLPERPMDAIGGVLAEDAVVSDLAGFLAQLTDKLDRLGRRVSETSERVDL